VQEDPTSGFHFRMLAIVVPYCRASVSHVFPDATLCQRLQPQTATGCVGVGADGLHVSCGGLVVVVVGRVVGVPFTPARQKKSRHVSF
jgi:hypothetical protein